MPYYLFKVSASDKLNLVKDLELVDSFASFRDAKTLTKKLRTEQSDADFSYRIMFADNQLSAEERLLEKREQPVLMEHER
ncbi:MAG: hypothetical protein OEN02_11145 [Gammaproteobacteria bacterium]|nr:hypothetical protein [Gammaproteobacteria bacterium]MDH3534630.1 hypothetical protein [Gammaproteobacteria bacterium]